MRKALDETKGHGIVNTNQDDGSGRARTLRDERRRRSDGDQRSDARADQFFDDAGQPLGALLGPAVENRDVATVGPAERGEIFAERVKKAQVLPPRPHLDKADARWLDLGRGRVPGDFRGGGEQERVAACHSMTSSARARIAGGTVSPSDCAVLRLTTS